MKAAPVRIRRRLAVFAGLLGPGIVTASVDNDAAGIATYSLAGADGGTSLLWTLVPITLLLVLVQLLVSRMGVVTGKGLADLIRENHGARATFWLMAALAAVNLGNVAAQFAGLAVAARMLGAEPGLVASGAVLALWLLVVKGSRRSMERIYLVPFLFYATYAVAAFLVDPEWRAVAEDALVPTLPAPDRRTAWLLLVTALLGTTVAPWMPFHQQAAVAEKEVRVEHVRYAVLDTVLGGVVVGLVATFIVVACAAKIHAPLGTPPAGLHNMASPADGARALADLGERTAPVVFALGLAASSLLAAAILPLSTAFSVCEGLGFAHGVNRRVPEAPVFYAVYGLLLLAGAAVAFLAHADLLRLMVGSQVLNGLLLPVVLYFILRLARDRRVMGRHATGPLLDGVAWLAAGAATVVAVLAAAALAGRVLGG